MTWSRSQVLKVSVTSFGSFPRRFCPAEEDVDEEAEEASSAGGPGCMYSSGEGSESDGTEAVMEDGNGARERGEDCAL